VSDTGPLGLLF